MKLFAKILILASAAQLGYCCCRAQVMATAASSATIITPISISKTKDMSFGNLAVSAATGGTLTLNYNSSRTTGGAGGVTLPANHGTVQAAEFSVWGKAHYTFSITLPSSCTISDGSGHTMTLNAFTGNPTATGNLGSGGHKNLKIGATLNVTAGQAAGTYTNASGIAVTVNYN